MKKLKLKLDRKQAGRLTKSAVHLACIKQAKRIKLNNKVINKTEAVEKLLKAIIEDIPFSVEFDGPMGNMKLHISYKIRF